MRKLAYLLIIMASACFSANGKTPSVTTTGEEVERHGALITVIDRTLDFGKFHGVLPQTGIIRYRNDGDSALYVQRVAPDCGCTVVDFSHEALPPDSIGEIKVRFDGSNRPWGKFKKMIRIRTNSRNGLATAYVTGEIIRPIVK